MNIYWGDIHNHNAIGYGAGSLRRTLQIADETLDFVALTPHGAWLDHGPGIPDRYMKVWREGCERLLRTWPDVVAAAAEPRRAVVFLGQEVHSSEFGDYCLIYPGDHADFFATSNVAEARQKAIAAGALLIPHHVAYARGRRGCDWSRFEADPSPVVEVFSEHGSSFDADDGWPMEGHSFGPRDSANTILRQLEQGRKFGFVASSDNHWGVPGAYGEGVCAVLAEEKTKAAIWTALRQRRTYAVTGDRIRADFRVNDAVMGSEIAAAGPRHLRCRFESCAPLAGAEIYKNGRLLHAFSPAPRYGERTLAGRKKLRLEYGWGPWSKLEKSYISEWEFRVAFRGCRIAGLDKCFRSFNFVHTHEHEVRSDDRSAAVVSYTSRNTEGKCPNNSLLFDLADCAPDAMIELEFTRPYAGTFSIPLHRLLNENRVEFLHAFPQESFCLHRLLGEDEFDFRFDHTDAEQERDEDAYCMRIVQKNQHAAWLSPVWVRA